LINQLERLTKVTTLIKDNQSNMDTTKEFTNLHFNQLIDLFTNLEDIQEYIKDIRTQRMEIVQNPLSQICSTELSNIMSYIYYNNIHTESLCKAIIYLNKKNLYLRE
jgi:hypothetical protein